MLCGTSLNRRELPTLVFLGLCKLLGSRLSLFRSNCPVRKGRPGRCRNSLYVDDTDAARNTWTCSGTDSPVHNVGGGFAVTETGHLLAVLVEDTRAVQDARVYRTVEQRAVVFVQRVD